MQRVAVIEMLACAIVHACVEQELAQAVIVGETVNLFTGAKSR